MYRAGGAVVSTITIVGINIMLQEMLGGLNRFKTHLISFIGNLLETVQKQKKQECDLESFIYTRSMHEINADSLRADHDSRFII